MLLPLFIVLAFRCMVSNGTLSNYTKLSDIGVLARVDLINTLKITLYLATPHPTQKERQAAIEFVRFLNTPRSDEYIEAFYANNKIDNTNNFQQFLNGVLFNGNPSLRLWRAAELLLKMLKTKTNSVAVEELRSMAKNKGTRMRSNKTTKKKNLKKRRMSEIAGTNPTRKQLDYIKIYKKPEITDLNALLNSVTNNLYGI